MENIIKFLKKNWTLLSILFTIISSLVTGIIYTVQRVSKAETTIAQLNDWVQDHDDAINQHEHDLTVLKEDERLREAGLLKR